MIEPGQAAVSVDDALALADMLQQVAGATDTAELASTACHGVRRLLGADGVTFVLAEGTQVYYAEEDAASRLWKGRRFPAAACISGWAIEHRVAAVIEDIEADPRIPLAAYRPTFVKSLIMTPLDRDEPLGALGVYWEHRHQATPRERFLVERAARGIHAALRRCLTAAASDTTQARQDDLHALATVAHDLRNPLAAVANSSQALAYGAANGAQRKAALRIMRSTAHAAHLVDQLLQYAKLERESLDLSVRDARLDAICGAAADEVRAAHPDRLIRVHGVETAALCDAHRLTDAIGNLVRNAVEHGAQDAAIDIHVESADEECRIRVHNSGPAIPVDQLPHLFDAFHHGPQAGNTSLGLGLHIAAQIVRAHGGRIEVTSSPRDGTQFIVRLPQRHGVLEPQHATPPAQRQA